MDIHNAENRFIARQRKVFGFHLPGFVGPGYGIDGNVGIPQTPQTLNLRRRAYCCGLCWVGHGSENPREATPGRVTGSLAWFWISPNRAFTALISDVDAIA